MPRLLLAAVTILSLAPSGWSQDIAAPAEIRCEPRWPTDLEVTSKGKSTRWIAPEGLYVRQLYSADAGKLLLMVIAKEPRKYQLILYTSVNDLPSHVVCWVIAGTAPPGPGPTPPPSPPDPVEPVPADDFERGLFAAWRTETASNKGTRIKELAAVYSAAAEFAAGNKDIKTVYQLYQQGIQTVVQMRFKAIDAADAEFAAIRKLIGAELNARLSTKINEPLTDDNRKLCQVQFTRVAAALTKLESVK